MPESISGSSDFYLTDISPRDKPWDVHREEAERVESLYRKAGYEKYADRIGQCSRLLGFRFEAKDTGEFKLKLDTAQFCRVRHCPVCQWRRTLRWYARFFEILPVVMDNHPTTRWIFLTLTVKNCSMDDLRETVKQMNVAWRRLSQRAEFPAVGWVKSLEVTRGENDSAHPHFHVLMMVKSSYFSHGYVKHERWVQLWQEAMRLNYAPSVNVRRVRYEEKTLETSNSSDTDLKLDDGIERFDNEARSNILLALLEAFKYTVKPGDLLRSVDPTWLVGLTQQLHKTKAVAVGGILKKYFNENEPEDLIDVSSEPKEVELVSDLMFAYFGWREMTHRYTKVSKGESSE